MTDQSSNLWTMIKIMVNCWLKLTESRELLTKKVTENAILTSRFNIFYHTCMKIDQLGCISLKSHKHFCFINSFFYFVSFSWKNEFNSLSSFYDVIRFVFYYVTFKKYLFKNKQICPILLSYLHIFVVVGKVFVI